MQKLNLYQVKRLGVIERNVYKIIKKSGICSTLTLSSPVKSRVLRSVLIRRFAVGGWTLNFRSGGRKIEIF